jgi:hypothetical protein
MQHHLAPRARERASKDEMSLVSKLREGIQQKSRDVSESLTERRRQRIGEDLAQEEERLKALAAQLQRREKAVAEREARLDRVYLLPKWYVRIPVGLAIVAAVAWAAYRFGPLLAQ